jgi:hypothetical protein
VAVLALIISHVLVAASPIMAQERDYWTSLVGNWEMEFVGKDRKLLATGYFVFHGGPNDRRQGRVGGHVRELGYEHRFSCDGSFDGVDLKLECGGASLTLRLSADGNTLRGTWSGWSPWIIGRDGRDGLVRWTRARTPTIDKVEVLSDDGVALDHAKMEQAWAARGHRPRLRLRLQGRDLPIWMTGAGAPRLEIAIDDPNYRIVHDASPSGNDLMARWQRGVLEVVVWLEPGARPGRKVITVNGGAKTFETVFQNYREASKVVELRFVRKDGSPLSEIGYGEPFHVEARFDVPPPEAQRIVKLGWGGGATDIPVIKQKDAKVFRSGLLYLEAPTTSTETPPPNR